MHKGRKKRTWSYAVDRHETNKLFGALAIAIVLYFNKLSTISRNTMFYASLCDNHCLHYRCTHVAVILTCPRNPHERLGTQYSE
ncbi:hypothetical protein DBV15_08305 [Temnothorax longispinosus]|uniref:Uncharacterized protein n=1 Tax=Temnothorax longispinosus TaxID=300112 RepID=A0A4S2KIG6_9HYME|nr:hypothetical protein DBV15_08305 [Temnothorax longispinosus]